MQDQTAPGRPFTGWHMLAIIVAFFAVIIGVNLWMAISAARTWTGLEVENSYVASQEFNEKLKVAHARDAAGWKGGLAYEGGALVFTLNGADGAPVDATTVEVEVHRPIGVEGDRTIILQRRPDGTYGAPIALDPGVWIAAIRASLPDAPDYEHHARLVIGGAVDPGKH